MCPKDISKQCDGPVEILVRRDMSKSVESTNMCLKHHQEFDLCSIWRKNVDINVHAGGGEDLAIREKAESQSDDSEKLLEVSHGILMLLSVAHHHHQIAPMTEVTIVQINSMIYLLHCAP
jgi:hypothetical protein